MKIKCLFIIIALSWNNLNAQQIDSVKLMQQVRDSFAIDNFSGALSIVEQMLKAYPNDKKLLLNKGFLCIKTERYKEAEGVYFEMAKQEKGQEAAYLANIAIDIAGTSYKENAIDAAMVYVNRALKLNSKDCTTSMAHAICVNRANRYKEAVTLADKAESLCQNLSLDTDLDYVLSLIGAGYDDRAMALLDKWVANGDDEHTTQLMRIKILYRKKDYEKAWDIISEMELDEYDGELMLYKGLLASLLYKKDRCGIINNDWAIYMGYGEGYDWSKLICEGKKAPITIEPGLGLTYKLSNLYDSKTLKITIKTYSAQQVAFDWTLNDELKGQVTLDKNSINTANSFDKHCFDDSKSTTLSKSFALLLSKALFEQIRKHEPMMMDIGKGTQAFTYRVDEPFMYEYWKRGIKMNLSDDYTHYYYTDAVTLYPILDGENRITVQNDAANPIILHADIVLPNSNNPEGIEQYSIELVNVE